MGRALHTAAALGWSPREGWWCWGVLGQEHPLHFLQEPLRQIQHRVWDSLRCHSSRQLEARRAVTFGGLSDGADGLACCAALPPLSWRSRCCPASWPGACGRRQGCWAMACEPTFGAPAAVRRTRTKSTSCGTARSGRRLRRHGAPASVTRQRPSPTWGPLGAAGPVAGLPSGRLACGGWASSPSGWRRGWIGGSWMSSGTALVG